MQKTIPVDEAVGMVLPHDVTRISKSDGVKGPAFRKGHIIRAEDIPRLKDLGKENIYVLDLGPEDIHENEAAEKLAEAAKILANQDQAIQLRYLQTLVEIAGDKSSTLVFPVPMDLLEKLKS